jgi:hypothetical protein
MAFKAVGAAKLYIGDFTGTPDVYTVVDVENVNVDIGARSAYTSNASLNGTPTVDGQYALAPQPVVQVTLGDADVTQLVEFMPGISTTTAGSSTAVGFGSTFRSISRANVPSLFILPTQQETDGVAAVNGIWLPGVNISGIDGINFGRVDEGEIQQFYNVSFTGVYCATDQASAAIAENARIIFMGPPAAFGLSWALS